MGQSARIWVFMVLSLLFGLFADLGAADPVILNNEDVNFSEFRAFDLLCKCETGCIVNTVFLSSRGSYLAVGGFDHNVFLFNQQGKKLWNYTTGDIVYTVSISPDGTRVAAGSDGGAAYLFERNSTIFARLFGDERFLSRDGFNDLYLDKEAETGLPLKEGGVTTIEVLKM